MGFFSSDLLLPLERLREVGQDRLVGFYEGACRGSMRRDGDGHGLG